MYEDKDQSYYFSSVRDDLIGLIPKSCGECNILEIGCGNGATLHKLKQLGVAKTTTGVELFPTKDNYYSVIDHIFLENVESILFPSAMYNSFDVVIMGDVIEHLVDPWSALKKVSNLLKSDGLILLSIPNIRYYLALKSIIINGDFKYEETGILDKTHLRFFCRKNVLELLDSAGLKAETITSAFDTETIRSKKYILDKMTFGMLHDFFIYQFLVVARKI